MAYCSPYLLFFYLFNAQINQFIDNPNEQQQFTIFLQPDTKKDKINLTLQQIRNLPNIAEAILIDNDQALKEIQYIDDINAAINALGGLNPLYHTVIITPKNLLSSEQIEELKKELKKNPNISDIAIDEQWIVFIGKITTKLASFFTAFAIISALIASTLIFYFMLIRCMTTNAEIKLKFYLGAYPWQLYQPYLGFGLVIGVLSGIIAVICTSLCYYFYASIWKNTVIQSLVQQPNISIETPLYLLLSSVTISLISSYIATIIVRKNILKDYLNIQ